MHDTCALPTAGLIRRLLALIYDSLLLLGVAFAYGVAVTLIRINLLGRDELDWVNLPIAVHGLIWAVLWGLLAGYYVLCWTRRGQTLGMKSWRLQIRDKNGHYPGAGQAWLRCLLAPVAALPLGLGYIWSWFDKRHGAWHDRWTGTRVMVLPKADKQSNPIPDA